MNLSPSLDANNLSASREFHNILRVYNSKIHYCRTANAPGQHMTAWQRCFEPDGVHSWIRYYSHYYIRTSKRTDWQTQWHSTLLRPQTPRSDRCKTKSSPTKFFGMKYIKMRLVLLYIFCALVKLSFLIWGSPAFDLGARCSVGTML